MARTIHRGRSDAALLSGDAAAFAAFYHRHEDALLGYFLRRTRQADLAADLTAEAFARALEGRRRFDPERGEARGWLFGIARNLLASSLECGRVEDATRRALRLEPMVLDDAALARIEELHAGPAADALSTLPAEQRDAVHGRVIEEAGYAELAVRLRCSESVVRQRVSRGLKSLRQRMEAER